jgi:hypothetical protein
MGEGYKMGSVWITDTGICDRDEIEEEPLSHDKEIGERIMEPPRAQYVTMLTT